MVDLEVVGRHALLFDDDANAEFVNSEEALVEWNSLLIDRYDVRHLLSGPPPPRNRRRQLIPPSDVSIAAELDRERFLDLNSSSDDEQEEDIHEERVIESRGFHSIGFSYGNPDDAKEPKNTDVETIYRPPFPVPQSLTHNLPPTEKVHQIIARTATFVSNNGGQSEIVLRVKQGDNPTFRFLMPDHYLHPYFRFLVDHQELLNSDGGKKLEKPGGTESDRTIGALSLLGSVYGYEDDDDDVVIDDLPTVKTSHTKENVDAINCTVSESLGSATVKIETLSSSSTKEKGVAVKSNPSFNSVRSVTISTVKSVPDVSGSAGASTNKTLTPGIIVPPVVEPPSELKRVVDKIVEFILRNGKEFEVVLSEQDRKYGRFPFLLQTNQYHPYYLQVLQNTQEAKLVSKGSVSNKEKKSSTRHSERDLPKEDFDKKEKSKMVLTKPKTESDHYHHHELPPKVNQPPPPELVIDAEAAAEILKAATRGIKDPGQTLSSTRTKPDSSEAPLLTEEQKLKAERLRRAKEFAATLKKNGATAPSKPDSPGPGKGSSAPVDDDLDRSEMKVVFNETDERRSMRTYRSKKSYEDDEDDRTDRDRSRKKNRSHRSSRHSRDRHGRRRSSSKRGDERFSDDDNDHDPDHDRRSSRKRRKNRSSSDEEDRDRRSGPRHNRGGSSDNKDREVEFEEGEILSAKSDRSKGNEIGRGSSREASQPLDSTEVPNDLRAKIRAMLMATMQ